MSNGFFTVPIPNNEPVLDYRPDSPERRALDRVIARMSSREIDIPARIGGRKVRTGKLAESVMPHDHGHVLGRWHKCGKKEVERAIQAALDAHASWAAMPWQHRVAIFLKAADLLAGPYRSILNASTMLGQSKTVHQAEIDSACEMIDFFRFNAQYMTRDLLRAARERARLLEPLEHRPTGGLHLRGHALQLHLHRRQPADGPGTDGQHVVWKPASSAVYSALLGDHGAARGGGAARRGSSTWCPDRAARRSATRCFNHPDLAGIHFTGSTASLPGHVADAIGENIENYKFLPADRGRDRRQGLHLRPRESADVQALDHGPGPRAPSSSRGRSARLPVARLHP